MTRETFLFDSAAIPGVLRRIWTRGDVLIHLLGPDVRQDGRDTTMVRYEPFILGSERLKTIYAGGDVMDADHVRFTNIKDGSVADAVLVSTEGTPVMFIQNIFGMPVRVWGEVCIFWSRGPNRVVDAHKPEKLTQRSLYPTQNLKTGEPNEAI